MKNPLSSLPFFHGSIIYLHLVFTLQGKKFNNLSKVTKIMNIKDSHHACLQSLEPNGSPSSPNVSETEARGSILQDIALAVLSQRRTGKCRGTSSGETFGSVFFFPGSVTALMACCQTAE